MVFICASVASSFSVHLWQCLVVAHQPQGVQVDEFHLRLFGVLRVVWLGFINPVAQFMGCNALLCLVVGNGHPAFPLTVHVFKHLQCQQGSFWHLHFYLQR